MWGIYQVSQKNVPVGEVCPSPKGTFFWDTLYKSYAISIWKNYLISCNVMINFSACSVKFDGCRNHGNQTLPSLPDISSRHQLHTTFFGKLATNFVSVDNITVDDLSELFEHRQFTYYLGSEIRNRRINCPW